MSETLLFKDVFEKINFSKTITNIMNDTQVAKINLDKETKTLTIDLVLFEMINEELCDMMVEQLNKEFPTLNSININTYYKLDCSYEEKINLVWKNILNEMKKISPLLYQILQNSSYTVENDIILLELSKNFIFFVKSKKFDSLIMKKINDRLDMKFKLELIEKKENINIIEKKKQVAREEAIIFNAINEYETSKNSASQPVEQKNVSSFNGNDKQKFKKNPGNRRGSIKIITEHKYNPTRLAEELVQDDEIIIIGTIFDIEKRELRNGKTLCSLDITDGSDSVTVKMFLTKEDLEESADIIKKGKHVIIKGFVRFDTYAKELNIIANEIGLENKKTTKKTDEADEKRVELHLHTNMSSMDGITSIKDYIKRADEWGHNAIAITDHGVVQAFPDAMKAVSGVNKSRKEKDPENFKKFKVIYGMEAYVYDDMETMVFGDKKQPLDTEYVVFDLETTGLTNINNNIIEIGAVKIKNFQIVDRFNTFVYLDRPVPEVIVKLTGITKDMLVNAPPIETVLNDFLDFVGSSVLVAQNASFDIGFLNRWCIKVKGCELENTFIDTVMMARLLLPTLSNHKLNTICKKLDIPLLNHHRAVDDAEATAKVFLHFLNVLKEKDIENISEINPLGVNGIDKKFFRPNHGIIIAQNKKGLKNLYELVSFSHIECFYKKRPRIPKSKLLEKREGLILGTACEAGELFRSVISCMPLHVKNSIIDFYDFTEIQPVGNNMYLYANRSIDNVSDLFEINKEIIRLSKEKNKLTVATGDVHFLEASDDVYRKILMHSEKFKDYDNQPPLYFKTTNEMLAEFNYLDKDVAYEVVVTNPNKIADMVEYIQPIPDGTSPPIIDGSDEELRKITTDKAYELYGKPLPEIVEQRLERELQSIISNGFSVMYIIAQKLVSKSVEDGYIVGSRGSVGSSFVATMAGITEVNPLQPHYLCLECKYSDFDSDVVKSFAGNSGYDMPDANCPKCNAKMIKEGHDIPFETFLGFDGDKEPDIDLNFSGEYQSRAHEYTEELFGKGYVFKAGTIGTVADKTAYGYTLGFLEEGNMQKRKAEIKRLSQGCTGVKKSTGQHPGGLMVVPSYTDIHEFCPVQRAANDVNSDIITTHFNYKAISGKLLKLDILGHDAPTILRMLHDSSGVDPISVDLGDKNVMSLFTSPEIMNVTKEEIRCDTGSLGLPEFGTSFVRQMLLDTMPTAFSELVRISGLSHGTNVWLNNAQELIKSGTVTLKEVIPTRDDIMVYLILKGVEKKTAFFIMEKVRKCITLSDDEINLMLDAGVPQWYIESCRKIQYLFPKGHAVAYVMMSVRIAYYKIYYPYSFYGATFSVKAEDFDYALMCKGKEAVLDEMDRITKLGFDATAKDKSTYTILELVLEFYARKLKFLPLDIYTSLATKFIVTEDGLIPPLCSIQGLGGNAAENIVKEREFGEFTTIENFRERTKTNKTVIEVMKQNNILYGMPETNQLSFMDM